MKPPPFKYLAPRTLEEALAALAEHGADAKILAGGQSLVPMLNFRLLRPTVLVDITRVPGLAYVAPDERGVRIGALTRHRVLETDALVRERFAVLAQAMTHVAHLAIRNRGTIGGSLAHADPAAELPMLAVLLDARIEVASSMGTQTIAARDFFVAALTSALEPHEMVVAVRLPGLPATSGWAFEEFARRTGDFALAGVGVVLSVARGAVEAARIGLMGVGATPLRTSAAEAMLVGKRVDARLAADAAEAASAAADPMNDLHASADYRRHLLRALVARALSTAWSRATGVVS
jgi:CO/xanthine dehydrogenase FAD-binding subunit